MPCHLRATRLQGRSIALDADGPLRRAVCVGDSGTQCQQGTEPRHESRMDLLYTCGSACSLGRVFVLTPAPAVRASV